MEWNCCKCALPIADEEGYLSVDNGLAYRRMSERAQWEADNPGPVSVMDYLTYPAFVSWEAAHTVCNPESGYDIPIKDVRTAEQLLGWTAHLMGKNWLSCTNWSEVIREKSKVTA